MIKGLFYKGAVIPLRLETGVILPSGDGDVVIMVKDPDGSVREVEAVVQDLTAAFAYIPSADQYGETSFQVKATFPDGILYGETETLVIQNNFAPVEP